MRRVLFLILCLFTAGLVNAQQNVQVMTTSEIRPGMVGYGLTVFEGVKPEKFRVTVVDVLEDYILVRFDGGPKDTLGRNILKQTRGFGGMSGSPVYINNKLIGAIAKTPDFTYEGVGWVTPIQNMQNLYPLSLENPKHVSDSSPSLVEAGESYSTCWVWGDVHRCTIATITMVDYHKELMYAQGHALKDIPITPVGRVTLPFWRGKTAMVVPSHQRSIRFGAPTGNILGTIIYNGEYGQIGLLNKKPLGIPVHFTLENALKSPVNSNFYVAYSGEASIPVLCDVLDDEIIKYSDSQQDVSAHISIKVAGLSAIEFNTSISEKSLTDAKHPLQTILMKILVADKPERLIEDITIKARVVPKPDVFEVNLSPGLSERDGNMFIHLRRIRDQRDFLKQVDLHLPSGANVVMLNGVNIREQLIYNAPLEDILELLNKLPNCDALYIVSRTEPKHLPPTKDLGSAWHEVRPEYNFLQEIREEGVILQFPDNKSISFVVK